MVLADQLYAAPKWNLVTREKRVRRLIEVLQLESPKMVKALLCAPARACWGVLWGGFWWVYLLGLPPNGR